MKNLTCALLLCGTFSSFAQAADIETGLTYDWSGAYVGLFAGYGFGQSEHYTTDIPASSEEFDFDGGLLGLTVGANVQRGNLVFGVESDLSYSSIEGAKFTDSATWSCSFSSCNTDLNWLATGRLRVGLALDSTMPYVTGGLAAGGVQANIEDVGYGGEGTLVGWTAGAGVEHAFSSNISAKIEYLYSDLGHVDLADFGVFGVGKADVNFSAIRLGLNYKF